MNNKKISRIQYMELDNFKNVTHGRIEFSDYGRTKECKTGDIMGIYGQNGSGKTAMVSAVALLKLLWQGSTLPTGIRNYIKIGCESAQIKAGVFFSDEQGACLAEYTVSFKNVDEKNTIIATELLEASFLVEGQWTRRTPVFSYSCDNKGTVFTPVSRYREVIKSNSQNLVELNVIKSLVSAYDDENNRIVATSFLFSKKMVTLINSTLMDSDQLRVVLSRMIRFAFIGLVVLENEQLAIISTNSRIIPITVRNEEHITVRNEEHNRVMQGALPIDIEGLMTVDKDTFKHYKYIIKQINEVLPMLVPGVSMEMTSIQEQLTKKGEAGIAFELASIRNGNRIPLHYESAGIKKIICLLSSLIAAFNHGDVCLVVDELDSGVYEYLLGQILHVASKEAKGQLIFTSHNLHALEVLDSKSLTFTTTNEENCFIQLTGVKPTNNFRDLYFRSIVLGGQQEYLYNDTNQYEISFAFRNAEEFEEESNQ